MRRNLKLPPFLRQKSWLKTRKMMFLGRTSPQLFLPRLAAQAARPQPSLLPSRAGRRQDVRIPEQRQYLKPSPYLQLPGTMPRLRTGPLSCLPEAIVPLACPDLMSQPQLPQVCPFWLWLQQNLNNETLLDLLVHLLSPVQGFQLIGFQVDWVPWVR